MRGSDKKGKNGTTKSATGRAGEDLSVHPRTIRKWQAMRVIPFVKVGNIILFDLVKVRAALEEFEMEGDMVKLTTEDGVNTTRVIYLEPDVYQALERFVRSSAGSTGAFSR